MADAVLENVPVVGAKRSFPRPFGRYVLEKSLSRGGMGEVFLTIVRGLNQRCVIKTIRGDLTGEEEFIGRFADEAKIMMRLQHENVIRVFDAGKVGNEYYIAMEYVHGRDLGDVLDRAYERGEPMPLQLGLYVASKLLGGLDCAHKLVDERGRPMGIVHRDISPQNVLIGFDGSVKLIDFGLARTDLLPGRTQGALAVGKYGYMSPEQARHERIDGRADIYSTGVMLFEVFTGDRLVDEQDQATLWQRVLNPKHRKPSTVVPALAPDIDELVMRAVAVRQEERFRDAAEMGGFVERLRSDRSNRDDFIRYLRYLYPKADFNAPPIPDLTGAPPEEAGEKSVIIASSREAALSVFGRGELPIEWTTQIDAVQLKEALAKYRARLKNEEERENKRKPGFAEERPRRPEPKTESEEPLSPDAVEATYVRSRSEVADEPTTNRRRPSDRRLLTSEAAVTQMVELRGEDISSAETRYTRPGRDDDRGDGDGRKESDTEFRAPALGTTRVAQNFRDDEMTVMMDAPPRNSLGQPSILFGDEDTKDGDLPTRRAQPTAADPSVSVRGRDIQERNVPKKGEKTNLRDRTDAAEAQAKNPTRPPPPKVVAHRVTVGTDPPPSPRRGEDTLPPSPAAAAEEPAPPSTSSAALAGIILLSLAVIIVVLVILLYQL